MCVCVRACVRVCVRACESVIVSVIAGACVCNGGQGGRLCSQRVLRARCHRLHCWSLPPRVHLRHAAAAHSQLGLHTVLPVRTCFLCARAPIALPWPQYSSFRLAKRALSNGTPVAVINKGPTRVDDLLDPHCKASPHKGKIK